MINNSIKKKFVHFYKILNLELFIINFRNFVSQFFYNNKISFYFFKIFFVIFRKNDDDVCYKIKFNIIIFFQFFKIL